MCKCFLSLRYKKTDRNRKLSCFGYQEICPEKIEHCRLYVTVIAFYLATEFFFSFCLFVDFIF
jgi:hypothetical protein